MDIGAKLFGAGVGLAVAGGIAFLAAISTGDTGFAVLAILLLLAAGLANLLATCIGFAFVAKGKTFRWWWPISMVGTLSMLYSGWISIQLH